jgi:hypothetical protein
MFPTIRTPYSMQEVEDLLRERGVSRVALPILAALVAVENAHGQSVYNNNFGNITVRDATQPHFVFPNNDRLFASYPTAAAGMDALLKRLGSKTHQRMMDAANNGDVEGFVRGMTTPHPETGMMYCPDCPPSKTLATYRSVVKSFGGVSSGGGLGLVLTLFTGPLLYLGWRLFK